MTGNPLKKAQQGDPFNRSAETFNYFIDAAQAEKDRGIGGGRGSLPIFRQSGIVIVKNDSGTDVDRYGVLGLSAPVIAHDDDADAYFERVAFIGVTPTLPTYLHKFAVTIEPIEDGEFGYAVIDGVVPVTVDILPAGTSPDFTDEDWLGYADVASSVGTDPTIALTRLQARPFGAAQILAKQSGTGEVQAYVRLGIPGGQTWYRGTLDDTLTAGGSQTVNLTSPSGEKVVAWDNFLGAGESLASGVDVGITYDPLADSGAGWFYVTEASC